ncbi:hypothetical protein [Cohnella luojiensis]|uniref:Uncharacterized protein n=1 Tax=Cohnella luojiensis TaxID=652876 RepID=A0A4Y8LMT4_9BACL|nr:hypothetical protein [Cohnella luojiensis]TFE19387.1 hypothetical protein E2980_23385 [Cohnella luojiensis]
MAAQKEIVDKSIKKGIAIGKTKNGMHIKIYYNGKDKNLIDNAHPVHQKDMKSKYFDDEN